MDYIAQPKDYWIAQDAINITLNALGNPNRTQGSVASGAAILCYIEGVDGLGYDNGHRFKTWPLTISPTYFNSNTVKHVYVAIPRSVSVGTRAVVVFPSEQLDIYGVNANDEQVGSTDYYYIWLQGIITETDGTSNREWQQAIDFGKKGTDEDLYDDTTSEWYQYSKVSGLVTFLKNIRMKAGTTFQNLILGNKELTGVSTSDTAYTDSDTLVATPGYVESQYLSKTHESEAQEQVGFLKGLWVKAKGLFGIDADGNIKGNNADLLGDLNVGGDADVDGILRALAKILTNRIESSNWTGDGPFDTGFQLLKGQDGVTSMVVDNLFVRMKAIFTELEIRKISYAGGNIIFSHAGSKVVRVEPIYRGISAEVEGHKAILDGAVDVSGNTAYLGGGTVTGHKLTITNSQSLYAYRCYLLADDGSTRTENWWRVDDQARCQTFNIKEGVYQNVNNQFYWHRVIATGSETLEDGKVYDYVDLSAADCMQGSTVPQAGDQLVQMGNRTDTDRQGFISIEVSGDLAPAFKVYRGVNSYTLDGKRKICISPKLTEIRANKFIEETSYGVFVQPRQRNEEWYYGMQCYYYDLVQYDGATWLCIYPESGIGGVIYTTDMPSEDSPYWRIYARKGKDGSDGKSFNILGSYNTEAELIAAHPTGEIGDAYIVAGYLYVWDAVNNRWHNSGQIKGDPGRGIRSAKISYGIGTATSLPSEWKDSVSELSIQSGDYLYVRTILYYTDNTQSDPSYSISRFGLDGAYKATAFCRTNKNISAQQLSGGTMENAVPNPFSYQGETITFTDGIPAGEAVVWAASNVFYGDGTQAGWTYARRMSDTATFDVEFSPNETKPADPSDDVSQREAQGWYDPTRNPSHDFTNSIWRAERHCKNGVWSAWAIEKIKGEKGDSITKQSEVAYYIKNTTGVRPAENDPNWSETKPTLNKGEWLFTKTVITWSDGSTTVLYTDERNPNDGVHGQDIIVDGATVMEYAVSDNNVTQPTQWHPYAEIVSQIVPGTWLWSRATTYYRKASSAAGSHDAGSSVNYSVNYNGANGINGRAVKSITEYYKATNSSQPMAKPTSTTGWDEDPNLSHLTDKWDAYHKYLWNMEKVEYTESNGSTTTEYTIPQILAIWTKDGDAGRGIDSIQNHYKITDSATPPAKTDSGWSNSPLVPTEEQPYLWNYETISWTTGTPATTETDVQLLGRYGRDGEDGTSAATCFLDKSVVFVKVDTDGYVLEDYDEFVHFSIYQGTNIIGAKSVKVTEDGHQQYVELTGGKMTDLTGTTITVNNHTAIIHSGASVSGHKVTLTGNYAVAPNALHLRVQRGSLIDEHVATLQVIAEDADGNEHLCIAPLSIQREVIAKDGYNGADGKKGEKGEDGYNTATVSLYQRYAPTTQAPSPAKPAGTLTYTFSTGVLSGTIGNWSQTIPAVVEGTKLFVTQAVARSQEATDSIAPNEWATPVEYVTDGKDAINSASILVYKRQSSQPGNSDRPANGCVYTFATGVLSGTLNEWSTKIPSGTNPCWVRQAMALGSGASDTIDASEWSGDASGKAEKLVENGGRGVDAANVMLTPENVILEQDEDNESTIDLTKAYSVVSVNKGGTPDNNFTLSIIGRSNCWATVDNNTKRVTITQIDTHKEDPDDPSSENIFYDNGYVDVRITYGGQNYDKRFGFYVNLLGTWKRTTLKDAETVAANKAVWEMDDRGVPQKNTYDYTAVRNAAQSAETWHSQMTAEGGWMDQTNTRLSTAESNISTVSRNIPKTNIFDSVDPTGWVKNDAGYPKAEIDVSNYRFHGGNDIYSPIVNLENGMYVFSAYVPISRAAFDTNGESIALCKGVSASDRDGSEQINAYTTGSKGDTKIINGVEYVRRYAVFNVVAQNDNYCLNLWGQTDSYADVSCPKFETGVTPTNFYIESGSIIKQSADEIDLSITNRLGSVGITIDGTSKGIRLQADKVTFCDAQGGNTDKIRIDPATGTLNAQNARITGGVFVDRVDILNEPAFYDDLVGKEVVYRFFDVTKGENLFGNYYAIGELTLKSNHLFVYSEGLRNRSNVGSYDYNMIELILPPAHHFIGQSIVITNESYGFTDDEVLLEVEYKYDVGNNRDYVCLTHKDFFQESDTYLYDSAPLDIDGAPYVTNASEKQVGGGKTIASAYLSNGIWQLLESSQGKKYYEIKDTIKIGSYAWLELTAVSGELQGWYDVDPQLAKTYNAVWMITRWEKK